MLVFPLVVECVKYVANYAIYFLCLQCFDTVDLAAGRASDL